jgi:hypothetical protein
MVTDFTRHNRPVSDDLPAIVYKIAAASAVTFVVLAWIFFGGWPHMGLVLAIVSLFFVMTLGIPFVLWLAWRRHREADPGHGEALSWHEWAAGEFETRQGRLTGANAAVEMLLPIAATAVGMIAIGTAFFVVSAGVG